MFSAMPFNRMGTVPLPLALHLASYTVLGLFCFFAGALNLIDPMKIPHGLVFLGVCRFSWGLGVRLLMCRDAGVSPRFLPSPPWLLSPPTHSLSVMFRYRRRATCRPVRGPLARC